MSAPLWLISDNYLVARRTYKLLLQEAYGLRVDEAVEVEEAINRMQGKLKKLAPAVWKGIAQGRLRIPGASTYWTARTRRIETLKQEGRLSRAESRQAWKYLIQQLKARDFNRDEITDWLGISPTP
jgi:hypothetical protein